MNLSIGQRIVIGFGLVFLLTFGFGGFQLSKLDEVKTVNEEIASDNAKIRRMQARLADSYDAMRAMVDKAVVAYLLSKSKLTDDSAEGIQREWAVARQGVAEAVREIKSFVEKEEAAALSESRRTHWRQLLANVGDIEKSIGALTAEAQAIFEIVNADNAVLLAKRLPALNQARTAFIGQVEAGENIRLALTQAGRDHIARAFNEAQTLFMVSLVILLVLGTIIAFLLHRSITQPLATFMGFVERVGRGDLTQKTGFERGDELGLLARHLDKMVDGLKEFASQSRMGAENLNSAAAETLASTKQQAASVEEQFAAVQETTATLEEIAQSGTQISDRAKKLTAAAEAASTAGRGGIDAVADTARAMDAIRDQAEAVAENVVVLSEKTQSIGEIIATVNDIAERCHLLALNAAIEAAAARENGSGFSVVANEIKNLADQAKEATAAVRVNLGDIQQGINASVMLTEEAVKRVGAGKEKTDSTQKSIHQLTENIQESVQAFQQIVAAVNQQQIGLEQVVQALQNIRQASEQTAAGTNQVEQAAANLSALGEQLLRSAGSYKL